MRHGGDVTGIWLFRFTLRIGLLRELRPDDWPLCQGK